MNDKELCLAFGIGFMINAMLIAWSIRYLYDNNRYGDLLIAITLEIVCVILIRIFLKVALEKEVKHIEA